jgi:hypothetical protein
VLKTIDVSRVSVALPVHEQPLIRACETSSYNDGDEEITCDIGLLDLEYTRFIRLRRLNEKQWECHSFLWSPDKTRFVYSSASGYACEAGPIAVYQADGSTEHHAFVGGFNTSTWSPDGRYLVIQRCAKTRSDQYGIVYTAYGVVSGEKICSVGWSHPMGICADKIGGLPNQCILPLADNRGWLLATSGFDLISALCDNPENCPAVDELEPAEQEHSQEQAALGRYRASIENYWLRVLDVANDTEMTYVLPGYIITDIAWPSN